MDMNMSMGMNVSGDGNRFSNPVCRVPFSIAANSAASLMACADGPEVIGAELMPNPGLTGTGGTSGGGGTITGDIADSWYINSGVNVTVSKEAVTDDQVFATTGAGTASILNNSNAVSFVSGQFYLLDVKVDKVVGDCKARVNNNVGANIQLAAFSLLQGTNIVWFKAASTNVGTILISAASGGSLVIRSASIKTYSPTNYLRAAVNTGAGNIGLMKYVNGVGTSLISAANPVQNKNYAPTGCCTDPDWDLDVTTGWTASSGAILTSVAGGRTGQCLQIAANGTLANPWALKVIAVKPGETWRYKTFFKAGTGQAYQTYVWDNTNAAAISGTVRGNTNETAGDWSTTWDVSFTIPAGCVSISPSIFHMASAGATTTFLVDDVQCYKTSTDDLVLVVDKTNPASAAVSLFHDGVQVGTTQAVTDATILNGRYHYLSGDFGASVLYKRRFALGSEIVNPLDAAWTELSLATVSNGVLTYNPTGTDVAISAQAASPLFIVGRIYKLGYLVVSTTSNGAILLSGSGFTPSTTISGNAGQRYYYPVCTIGGGAGKVRFVPAAVLGTIVVSGYSVKEVLLP